MNYKQEEKKMKKKKTLIIAIAAILVVAIAVAAVVFMKTAKKKEAVTEIALVTDVGTIDDESFNQACWQGVEAYATANNLKYQYYQPAADSDDERLNSIDQAVSDGAKVIVLPGYLFGATVAQAQQTYPDVKFIAIDVSAGDLGTDPLANLYCAVFGEEQAGYVAGYAAVKDGYTKLGFLGGMAVPAVQRYGFGFVQGANDAAVELGTPIEINYTYGGQFFGDANITAKMDAWYAGGTEIVFACGGGIWTSAVEAALAHEGFVIGVDVDQHYLGEAYVADYGYNPFVTSAMKQLQNATENALAKFYAGEWATIGGKIETLDLSAGDFVGLPTAESSWCFKTFTVEEYNAMLEGIKSGAIAVSNALEAPVTDASVVVNYME
ncbi:MAG: BMP family ABC transporter substrate-binding protein [Clostridia bacterium]|nr:BMP family ABC transporter substrate-binding protein [Clostridia bacterium]